MENDSMTRLNPICFINIYLVIPIFPFLILPTLNNQVTYIGNPIPYYGIFVIEPILSVSANTGQYDFLYRTLSVIAVVTRVIPPS